MATFARKLTKSGGGSSYVTLPTALLRGLGWRRGQKVSVAKRKGAIVLRDSRTKKRR